MAYALSLRIHTARQFNQQGKNVKVDVIDEKNLEPSPEIGVMIYYLSWEHWCSIYYNRWTQNSAFTIISGHC